LIGIAAFGLKKKNIMAFAVILFLATFSISSNLIFPIGTLMNERFMYIPSLGFALALVYLINKITINKMLINTFIVSVVVLFSIKTFSRNFAWKNDYALAMADVETSKYSAKINMSAGGALIEKCKELTDTLERKKTALKAVEYLEWSLKLYPGYGQPIDLLGNAHFEAGNYNESIKYFETFITSNPTDKRVVNNVEIVGNFCMQKNLIQQAEYAYKVRIKFDPPSVHAYAQLGEIFGKHKNNLDSSLYFLEKAYSIQPENTDVLQKMGVVYAMKNNPQQALLYFTKALDIDPQNAHIMLNMSIAYRQMGQNDKAEEFFARAKALNSSI
jgi:protein O-mannosyl-transferase